MWIAIAAVVGLTIGFVVGYWVGHDPRKPEAVEDKPEDK